ncbi:MAG: hypothetical protein MK116_00590 [Phycisphaerales bacterium]|nr:hypothetical protein [Phycisphaerales bacterium]
MKTTSSCAPNADRPLLRTLGFSVALLLLAATSSVQAGSYWNNYGYTTATGTNWGAAATAYTNPYAAYANPYATYANPYAGYAASYVAPAATTDLYSSYATLASAFTWDYDDLYDLFDWGYDDYSYDYGTSSTYDYYDYSYNDYMYDNYYYEPTYYSF